MLLSRSRYLALGHHISRRLFSQLKVNTENNIKTVVLSNTKTRNALSLSMIKELKEALLITESGLRCIILKAEGHVFSSGHNLKEFVSETGCSYHEEVFLSCSELMQGLPKLEVPVICQVNGIAAAAGCQLVASCDIVVASDKSSFMTPGATFGVFCSTPGIPLVRNVPPKVSADMLLTGLPLTASQALNAGLVSAVVPEEQLEIETNRRVGAIIAKSQSVIALGKRFLYEQMEKPVADAYKLGTDVMVKNIGMKDGQEGIQGFINKRKPEWTHQVD